MRFMVLVKPARRAEYEGGVMPEEKLLHQMMKYNEELVNAGVMVGGDGLHPSTKGARIQFASGGKRTVTDGPFTESRELIGGYWLWQVKSKEEALEWARRAPMENGDELELRQIFDSSEFGPEVAKQADVLREQMDKRSH